MLKLRPYQQEAVDAVYQHLRHRDDNPCVVLPTGTGKGVIIAPISHLAVKTVKNKNIFCDFEL